MRKTANVLLVLATLAVSSYAQETKEGTGGETSAAFKENVAKMSNEEMTAKADAALLKLREVRKYVQNLLEAARKAKDIIKITCLNDKLTQINVKIRTYEDRVQSLRNAIKIADMAARNHEYTVLFVLDQQVTNLRMEAETCVGEAEGYLGKTEVTVTPPKGMGQMDPTKISNVGTDVYARPTPASAFQ